MSPGDRSRTPRAVEAFVADVVHELRTPLVALSGEVELALRRQRSVVDYQQALSRIEDRVSELVELTSDLEMFAEMTDVAIASSQTAMLDELLASLAERYRIAATPDLHVEAGRSYVEVAGDGAVLQRGLVLLVDHALRHRRAGAEVRLRETQPGSTSAAADFVALILDAGFPGFMGQPWYHLGADPMEVGASRVPGRLRLQTAARILQFCGGSLSVDRADTSTGLEIRLRCVHTDQASAVTADVRRTPS